MGGALGGAGAVGAGAGAGVPPGSTVIHVTEEEKAAIERVSLDRIYPFKFAEVVLVGSSWISTSKSIGSIPCMRSK